MEHLKLSVKKYGKDYKTAIGKYLCDEVYIIDTLPIADYIDYERLGSDVLESKDYIFAATSGGNHFYAKMI